MRLSLIGTLSGLIFCTNAYAANVRLVQRADGTYGPGSAAMRVTQEDVPLNIYGEHRAFSCVLGGIVFDPIDATVFYDGAPVPAAMGSPNQIDLVIDTAVLGGSFSSLEYRRDNANPATYPFVGTFAAALQGVVPPLDFAFIYNDSTFKYELDNINGAAPDGVLVDFEATVGGVTTTFIQALPFYGFPPPPSMQWFGASATDLVLEWQTAMPLDMTGGLNQVTQPWLSALDAAVGTGPGTRFLAASARESGGWTTIKGVPVSGSLPFRFEGNAQRDPEVLVWQSNDGDFNDPSNWSPAVVPGQGDSMIWERTPLGDGAAMVYLEPPGSPVFHTLQLGGGSNIFGGPMYLLQTQGVLRIGSIVLGSIPSDGDVIYQLGGGAAQPVLSFESLGNGNAFELHVAAVPGSNARFNMSSGTVQGYGDITVEPNGVFYQETGTISIHGISVRDAEYTMDDGQVDVEYLTIASGVARLRGGAFTVGRQDPDPFGGIGVAVDVGGSAQMYLSGSVSINQNAIGPEEAPPFHVSMAPNADGVVYDQTSGDMVLYDIQAGGSAGGVGRWEKTGTGTIRAGQITLGLYGTGHMSQSAGTVQTVGNPGVQGDLVLGVHPDSYGSYTLSGGVLEPAGLNLVHGQLLMTGGVLRSLGQSQLGSFAVLAADGIFDQAGGTVLLNKLDNAGSVLNLAGPFDIMETVVNTGVVFVNGQRMTVGGDYTQTAGRTTANAVLQVNGQARFEGGVLAGVGQVGGRIFIGDGARLEPGNSPGTLFVDGNLTTEPGSAIMLEVDGTAADQFDRLVVSGAMSLAGTVWFVLNDNLGPADLAQMAIGSFFLSGSSVPTATGITDPSPFSGCTLLMRWQGQTYVVSLSGSGQIQVGAATQTDGGFPESDAGLAADAGVSTDDGGVVTDAGGVATDAGSVAADGGPVDAAVDAGSMPVDSGVLMADAGISDAGRTRDGSAGSDAGQADAASPADAALPRDSGVAASTTDPQDDVEGCGCAASGTTGPRAAALLVLVGLLTARARAPRRSRRRR